MLPVDALADIVAHFKYFDLGPLLLTNKQFSDLARRVTTKICISDFTELGFIITDENEYCVYSQDSPASGGGIHSESFANETDFVEFVSEAFPHCIVGNLDMDWCCESVMRAIREAAKTVTVTDTLSIIVDVLPPITAQELVDFVGAFRRVSVSLFG
ncbi:hypothetical protein AAVH_17493 [Aphelenchoides avenae]|nr:hypothetical protein AAVH_25394 [Aphelenchus avenae]KAH7709656.1 hypothetical protein AAVH_23068 [Aphelenchus avenae]KAH7715115.1 hypothetical protein AAVH_17493 [Aphelenchus avenae]